MNYARALKIIRAAKNLSQQEFAKRISLSKSLVSRIESGKRNLTEKNIELISEKLDVPLNLIKLLAITSKKSKLPEKDIQVISNTLLSLLYEN